LSLRFKKQFQKSARQLSAAQQDQLKERLELFLSNPYHSLLHNHQLSGDYADFRSINISGDLRALYYVEGDDYIFAFVGTHAQLYR
jgi:addiction module RelE/StbE family toxin